MESQLSTIVTLSKGCKSAKVVRDIDEVPAGCGSAVVSHSVAVHTLVRVSIFGQRVFLLDDRLFYGK
jgi:valyl-tRNA synthetase